MSDRVVDLLTRGRQNLIERGHAKHAYVDDDNHVCAVGALLVEVLHDEGYHLGFSSIRLHEDRIAVDRAETLLRRSLNEGSGNSIISFNDRTTTTLDDVVALYDRAIEAAQQ